jgi:hypothetical protein
MKAIHFIKLTVVLFCLTVISSSVISQEYKKPDPVKNSTLDMLVGTWEAEPYEMMGETRTETATHYYKNGQYMFIDISGGGKSTYNATVILKVNSDGTFTGWSFDDWGFLHTYTGTASGNKVSVSGKGDAGTEQRDIEINGNKMTQKVTFNMKGPDGKDMVMNMTINYNKK